MNRTWLQQDRESQKQEFSYIHSSSISVENECGIIHSAVDRCTLGGGTYIHYNNYLQGLHIDSLDEEAYLYFNIRLLTVTIMQKRVRQ